jgi:FHA domain
MTAVASYEPGDWVAVSAPGTWLLVALPPDHPIVQRCWELMSGAAATEDILDVLVSEGIRSAPHFAFACATDQRRVLARGTATITVTDSAGAVELKVAADAGAVWAEEGFLDAVDLILLANGSAPASEIELPMASGVTMASRIRIRTQGPDLITLSTRSDTVTAPLSKATDHATDPSTAERSDRKDEAPRAESGPAPADAVRSSGAAAGPGTADATGSGAVPRDPAGSYDFLFGATQRPLPLDTEEAGPPSEPTATADPGLTAGWSTMAPPDLAGIDPSFPPIDKSDGGHIIDAVPWLAPAVAPRASQATPSAPPGSGSSPEHIPDVMQTIDRAALLAAAELAPVGPTVLAGYCPAGHLSPPYAATCRVCRAPMPTDRDGFEITRPALGVIRLADGGSVTLDRGVLFGRAPEAPAGTEECPHLVRLVSPENDVSRNHAQIVIDGWHVYVKDLGSTNGTVVTLPGRPPVRLRPDDLQLLDHGSSITLADEVTVTFEVTS